MDRELDAESTDCLETGELLPRYYCLSDSKKGENKKKQYPKPENEKECVADMFAC